MSEPVMYTAGLPIGEAIAAFLSGLKAEPVRTTHTGPKYPPDPTSRSHNARPSEVRHERLA